MDAATALEVAQASYERCLAAVGTTDWDRPTPCPEWTVRQLAEHVARCAILYRRLLVGEHATDFLPALRVEPVLGDDPVGATRAAWGATAAALATPGAQAGEVHHPAGTMSAAWLAVLSVEELTVHGWDLARATGQDETIDEDVADFLVAPLTELLPRLSVSFAAPSAAADGTGATASQRVLGLTGRS